MARMETTSVAPDRDPQENPAPARLDENGAGGRAEEDAREEEDPHRAHGQRGQVGAERAPALAEKGAAARGDDVRVEPQEIGRLKDDLGQDERRSGQEPCVFRPDERIVEALVVGRVQDEPEPGQDRVRSLEKQGRVAERVHLQGAGGAHGPDEEAVDPVGREHEQGQGQQLGREGIAQERRDEIGLPLEAELELAAAPQVPPPQDLGPEHGGVDDHEARQQGGREEGQDERMEDHRPSPSIRPSRM